MFGKVTKSIKNAYISNFKVLRATVFVLSRVAVTDVNKFALSKTSQIVLLYVMNHFNRAPTIYINIYCNNQLMMNYCFLQDAWLAKDVNKPYFQSTPLSEPLTIALQTSDRPGAEFDPLQNLILYRIWVQALLNGAVQ